jgi:hypothetical protein
VFRNELATLATQQLQDYLTDKFNSFSREENLDHLTELFNYFSKKLSILTSILPKN